MIGDSILHRAALALSGLAAVMAFSSPVAAAAPGRAELNAVARCVVSKDRTAAARAARALPLSNDPVAVTPQSLGDAASCVSSTALEGPSMIVRGAIAQAFYFADFRESGMQPLTPVRNLVDLGWPALEGDAPANDQGLALFKLADCIARNDAENVDKLMRAPYGSPLAKKMIDLLQPFAAICAKGEQISASRDSLQAAIAQGAYYAGVRYWAGQLSMVLPRKNGQ